MIYLIVSDNFVTAVVDNPNAGVMRSILETILRHSVDRHRGKSRGGSMTADSPAALERLLRSHGLVRIVDTPKGRGLPYLLELLDPVAAEYRQRVGRRPIHPGSPRCRSRQQSAQGTRVPCRQWEPRSHLKCLSWSGEFFRICAFEKW